MQLKDREALPSNYGPYNKDGDVVVRLGNVNHHLSLAEAVALRANLERAIILTADTMAKSPQPPIGE